MISRIKIIWRRIYRDVQDAWQPVLIIGIYILFMNGLLGMSVCPFRGITGLPCPACGMTRAGLLYLQGDFRGAFEVHPFIYGILGLAIIFCVFRYLLGKNTGWLKYPLLILGIGLILYYLYRMLFFFPDVEPMTYMSRSLFGRLGVWERLGLEIQLH